MIEIYNFGSTRIEFCIFDRDEYTLLVVEFKSFAISDLKELKNNCPLVEEAKGVAIVSEPEVSKDLIKSLVSHYKTYSQWVGNYEPVFGGIIILEQVATDLVRVQMIKARLFCLECFRRGVQTELSDRAKRPYCSKHYHCSPYYANKRKKKLALTAQSAT